MTKALPDHMKAPELKRLGDIAAGLLKKHGGEVGGVEITPDGTVRVLDKDALPSQPKGGLDKWVS
ncbi:MAG: hypothetical protein QNI84_13215 [Henriciella sp.]|nr:hypothetical protein [Henriciella sp.]